VLITTVGHSLGAGLARYIYLQIPQVTRVVGFDPSPIDGSSMVAVQDRPFVMTGRKPKQGESADDLAVASAQVFRGELIETAMRTESGGRKPQSSMKAGRRQPVDHDPIAPGAAIFMLHERGEILSLFAPCQSGEIWGSEGGPRVACHVVNWSSGNPFRQHNMAELACRMSLCFQGISPRRDREVCSSSLQTSRSSP
jgi:pimeloyl-ACP methyl ester carboxylesterase